MAIELNKNEKNLNQYIDYVNNQILVMVFLGLMLLMVYLKQSVDYQSRLRQ